MRQYQIEIINSISKYDVIGRMTRSKDRKVLGTRRVPKRTTGISGGVLWSYDSDRDGGRGTIICGLKNFESETFLWGRNYLSERINFRRTLWMQTLCELFSLFCLFRGVGVGFVIRWYMVWFEIDRPFVSLVILAWHHSVPTQSVLKFRRSLWR